MSIPRYTLFTEERPDIAKGTIGVMFDQEMKIVCHTLELPWYDNKPNISCIPDGFYRCVKDNEGKFQYWRVEDVSGRFNIEFHNGNFLKHTQGCILVGNSIGVVTDDDGSKEYAVWTSKNTLYKLELMLPNEFMLCIIRHRSYSFGGLVPIGNVQ